MNTFFLIGSQIIQRQIYAVSSPKVWCGDFYNPPPLGFRAPWNCYYFQLNSFYQKVH